MKNALLPGLFSPVCTMSKLIIGKLVTGGLVTRGLVVKGLVARGIVSDELVSEHLATKGPVTGGSDVHSDEMQACIKILPFLLILFFMLFLNSLPVKASEGGIEELALSISREHLIPQDTFEVILAAESVENLQYMGLELAYDTARFAFEAIEPGDLFAGQAVYIAEHMPNATLGASISSKGGAVSGSESIFLLRFRVREQASAGTFTFSLLHVEAVDFDNNPVSVTDQPSIDGEIAPYIIDVGMVSPGSVSIARGEMETFCFRMQAEGLEASDIQQEEFLMADIGILHAEELPDYDENGNHAEILPFVSPEEWPEEAWSELAYAESSEEHHYFEAAFPTDLPTGIWLVAGRFQLDHQPVRYAGYSKEGGGSWDGETNLTAIITVTPQRILLAWWSFDNKQWSPDTGIFDNLAPTPPEDPSSDDPEDPSAKGAFLQLEGASFNGWITGSAGQAVNSNNWHLTYDEVDNEIEKYWMAGLSGQGYKMIRVSYEMRGSNTGPRDFELEFNTGGDNWLPVPGSAITVSSTSFTKHQALLPVEADDTSTLNIRWLRSDTLSINGDDISSAGTNRIDEVRISGVPIDDSEMEVWPGDTSASGTVSEEDVTTIGYYWMSQGPSRIPQSVLWTAQPVIRWIPEQAGHADTNGDGRVDYRDIMAIGRNFGATTDNPEVPQKRAEPLVSSVSESAPLFSLQNLPPLSRGETINVQVIGEQDMELLGLSTRIHLSGLPDKAWNISEINPGDWANDWRDAGRLISFGHHSLSDNEELTWHAAWAHKGVTTPQKASELFSVTLRAETDWDREPDLHLKRLSLMSSDGTHFVPDPSTLKWLSGEGDEFSMEPELPQQTGLHPNYPNPFNPLTTIPFDMAEAGPVRLVVYDALGRRVITLINESMEPGRHTAAFDATGLSSGIYMYRFETNGYSMTRKMTLVK